MWQYPLAEVVLAADPIHDLERAHVHPPAGRAGHERNEVLGLVRTGTYVERLERQARVADPRVAIVPVALPADGLRERAGGRRDNRPGRPVCQTLEHARSEAHELAVWSLV